MKNITFIKIPKWLRPNSGYRLHIIFGIIIALGFWFLVRNNNMFELSTIEVVLAFPLILFYSILPDLDLANSKIRGIITVTILVIALIAVLMEIKMLALGILVALILIQFLEHRKFIHSVLAGLLFSLPFVLYSLPLAIFAMISYMSHLLLDGEVKLI